MNILKKSALSIMALSLFSTSCTSATLSPAKFEGRIIEYKSDASGFDTKTFFYEGRDEVVAFDTQFTPELAKKAILHLRTITNKPITHLVITHPNPDKFNGISVFKNEGAKVISSISTTQAMPGVHEYKKYYFVEMAKMFTKDQYPKLDTVDETFNDQEEIILQDGERIFLKELSQAGVSITQTVAFIPSKKALIVGDLIHYKAHAWLEGGIVNGKATPTIDSWITSLHEIKKLFSADSQVFAGRGQSTKLELAVNEQVSYLQKARILIKKEVKNKTEFTDYKSLTAKFEKEFPGYELSYLIEYGAYGLVNAELKL